MERGVAATVASVQRGRGWQFQYGLCVNIGCLELVWEIPLMNILLYCVRGMIIH